MLQLCERLVIIATLKTPLSSSRAPSLSSRSASSSSSSSSSAVAAALEPVLFLFADALAVVQTLLQVAPPFHPLAHHTVELAFQILLILLDHGDSWYADVSHDNSE